MKDLTVKLMTGEEFLVTCEKVQLVNDTYRFNDFEGKCVFAINRNNLLCTYNPKNVKKV